MRQIKKLLYKRARIVGELCMRILSELLEVPTKMQPRQKQRCNRLHHLIVASLPSAVFTECLF